MYSLPLGKIFFRVCAYVSQVYLGVCKNENFCILILYTVFSFTEDLEECFLHFFFMFTLHTVVQVEFQYPVKMLLILTRI